MYGLLHLHTPLMFIVGHSDCGAIKAACGDFSTEPAAIQQEVHAVKTSLEKGCAACIKNTCEDGMQKNAKRAELNVDMQVEELMNKPEIHQLLMAQKLIIVGMILDLHNVYGGGCGKLYTININGERNVDHLREKAEMPAKSLGTLKRLSVC
jgi:carbonic anhydrase